jgi:hypothetical protein
MWPILPSVVPIGWRTCAQPPHGAGSTTGMGKGAGSTTGWGRGYPQPPPHHGHGAGSTICLGMDVKLPGPHHGAGSTTVPPGAVSPPGPDGCCAKTASNRVKRSSILLRASSAAIMVSVFSSILVIDSQRLRRKWRGQAPRLIALHSTRTDFSQLFLPKPLRMVVVPLTIGRVTTRVNFFVIKYHLFFLNTQFCLVNTDSSGVMSHPMNPKQNPAPDVRPRLPK